LTTLIRSGIAKNIAGNVRGMQVNNRVTNNMTPPSCDIRRGPIEYDQALDGGTHRLIMLVRAYLANPTDVSAVNRLESYLAPEGDNSIKAAIESDRTLEGLVADLHVTGATGEQPYTAEGQPLVLGSEWTVEIWL
jgi:hypothetical protein